MWAADLTRALGQPVPPAWPRPVGLGAWPEGRRTGLHAFTLRVPFPSAGPWPQTPASQRGDWEGARGTGLRPGGQLGAEDPRLLRTCTARFPSQRPPVVRTMQRFGPSLASGPGQGILPTALIPAGVPLTLGPESFACTVPWALVVHSLFDA